MLKILYENLNLVLATVAIPFAIMVAFSLIRKRAGNAVTAMPDVLIFVFSVNLYFAVWPEPWKNMVHPLIRESFTGLSAFFLVSALIAFLFVLPVERKLASYKLHELWPVPYRGLMPPEMRNQNYPHVGLIASWISIATFVIVNALVFVLR